MKLDLGEKVYLMLIMNIIGMMRILIFHIERGLQSRSFNFLSSIVHLVY